MNVKPLRNQIIVKEFEQKETTSSGLVIPESAKGLSHEGEVVAVGVGHMLTDGTYKELEVKVGDTVLYRPRTGTQITLDDVEYLVLSDSDVLLIVGK